MTAAVGEGVELLHIAQLQAGLILHPGAKAAVQRPVADRCEHAERQPRPRRARIAPRPDHQNARIVAIDRDDRRREADLDGNIALDR